MGNPKTIKLCKLCGSKPRDLTINTKNDNVTKIIPTSPLQVDKKEVTIPILNETESINYANSNKTLPEPSPIMPLNFFNNSLIYNSDPLTSSPINIGVIKPPTNNTSEIQVDINSFQFTPWGYNIPPDINDPPPGFDKPPGF